MSRRLRIQSINVQTVLVWDDGEELTPGPELRPLALTASAVPAFLEGLPAEVAKLQEQMEAQEYKPAVGPEDHPEAGALPANTEDPA